MPVTSSGLYVPAGGEIGEAFQQLIGITGMVPGGGVTHKVDGAFYEEVINAKAFLTTDATAGLRSTLLFLTDSNGSIIFTMPSAGTQPPSTFRTYNYTNSLTVPANDTVGETIGGPTPRILLMPGWTLNIAVRGVGAGDLFTAVFLVVNRIPTGTSAPPPTQLFATPVAL